MRPTKRTYLVIARVTCSDPPIGTRVNSTSTEKWTKKLKSRIATSSPGKVAVWRARNVTAYMAEFLPPEAVPLPVHESLPSLSVASCVTDVMQFERDSVGEEYERDDNDSWLVQREQFLEDSEKI